MIFRLILCLLCFFSLLYAHPAGLPDTTICTNGGVNDFNFADAGFNTVSVVTGNRIFLNAESSSGHCAQQKKEALFMRHFLIEQNLNITAHPAPDLAACDTSANGIATFDLTVNDNIIISGQSGATVSYHETVGDAQTGTAAIPNPQTYTNTSNPQTIYARIQDGIGNFDTTSFDLIVNPNPVPGSVSDMAICDSGNGSSNFDLNIPSVQIINGQPDITTTFYLTQAEAETGTTGQLPMMYTHTGTGGPLNIYARMENNITECFTIVAFTIEVVDAPPITSPITDYMLCDNNQDGVEEFDLTSKENEILNSISPGSVTITYHQSVADRTAGIAVVPANTYISSGQTIYFRVTYIDPPNCYSDGEFEIGLHPPVAFNPPVPLQVCDEGAANGIATFNLNLATTQITGNDPNLSVTYYETQAQAETGNVGDQLPMMYQNQNPFFQTIYVCVVNLTTGCYGIAPLDLIVEVGPATFVPDPLTFCDPDNDGFGFFTLTDAENQITGGAAGVDVTYHHTATDANNGVNTIDTTVPFNNYVPYNQTIYVRVEISGIVCYNTTELQLQVLDTPQLVVPDVLIECDTNGNGTAVFDLTEVEPQMMANITNPGDYNIFYYTSAADLANDNPIIVPGAYTNVVTPQQTIYVVVEDDTNNCTKQVEFDLIVADMPVLFPPTPLELCDVNNPGDEQEEFNLSLATLEITGGDTSIQVTYHLTQNDADAGVNPIGPLYINVVNYQTIYIRAETLVGCVISQGFTLTLIVNPLPSPAGPYPLEACDPDSNGFAIFDLDSKIPEILNNEPDVVITFHETLIDAQDGNFALMSPYLNVIQYQQTIYVRAENTLTGCFAIVELLLLVNDSPDVPLVLDDMVICSEDPPGIGILFDLTFQDSAIYGTQDPTLLNLSYHSTQGDAQTGTNAIANPSTFANITNPQTIYIRLEDIYNGCFATNSFDLIVAQLYIDQSPNDIYINEGDGDGIAVFDLTVNEPLMLGTQNTAEITFSYFESLNDAENNTNAIQNPEQYVNTANPQTIFVRMELNLATDCYLISSFEIETDEFLNIHIPDSFQLTLYPNPVKGDLFLSTIDTINKVEVFTLNGQKLQLPVYNLESNQRSIDFSGLATGVYLVKITTPNGKTVKRVIKQ